MLILHGHQSQFDLVHHPHGTEIKLIHRDLLHLHYLKVAHLMQDLVHLHSIHHLLVPRHLTLGQIFQVEKGQIYHHCLLQKNQVVMNL